MKKTLLVAALVAGFAGMASASTVTLSGELKAEAKATVGYVSSDLVKGFGLTVAPSWEAKFALSGSEDLSNGLKAIFEIETEVAKKDVVFLNNLVAKSNGYYLQDLARGQEELSKKQTAYTEKEKKEAKKRDQAYEAAKDKEAEEKKTDEEAADKAYEAGIKAEKEALEKAKADIEKFKAENKIYKPVDGGYGLNVKKAYVGLSGEMGTITFGLQEDEIYTKDKLFSDALHVANPLVKYVGKFGGAKVALNLADFHAVVAGGVAKVADASGVGLVATGNFSPVSLSAQYSMYGVTGGLTLATSHGFNNIGAALQLAYTYDKMVTVAAGYGYEFDVVKALEIPHSNVKSTELDEKQKADIKAAKDANASRHHHRAFVGVKGKYAIDDMSDLEASAEFQYSYNVAKVLEHSFGGKVTVDYTYNMSKRTSVGVGLELVAPTVATTEVKDKAVEVIKPFSSALSVSLKHKF